MKQGKQKILACSLSAFGLSGIRTGDRVMEFHIHAGIRSRLAVSSSLFASTGNLILPDFYSSRVMAEKIRSLILTEGRDAKDISAGKLNAMALIDEILHIIFLLYRESVAPDVMKKFESSIQDAIGKEEFDTLLNEFCVQFPPRDVYQGLTAPEDYLAGSTGRDQTGIMPPSGNQQKKVPNRELALEELILLKLANENPAFKTFKFLYDDGLRDTGTVSGTLSAKTKYSTVFKVLEKVQLELPGFGPTGTMMPILELLRLPARMAPDSVEKQLLWIRDNWGATFREIKDKVLKTLDLIQEEEMPRFPPGPGPIKPYQYALQRHEYEKFSSDQDWMPSLVMIAKNALVWLHQLSVQYGTLITRLDEIPDQELDLLAERGINGLWLIGIWQRSPASEKIKQLCGNPDAAASAYSLFDYEIAPELGGWEALDVFRGRCMWRGIRLAADMVPNHTGIDSAWVRNRPDLFIGTDRCPFPSYTFNGPDLSSDPAVGIWLEDHYYTRSDAAVVFKRLDRRTGKVRYLYHGNDGTGMAWNDTAQIDFLNPEARAAVKERIIHVAQHFSIIRFDAAMVLARQHIRRLWYPAPGTGGAIPSRAEHSMSDEAFDKAHPNEFWREVVDECAVRVPDTLLLAEAFWMMEGYFVRTLGMHRVYNSAFMNMLKTESNSMYRLTIKNTQEFDKQILKRFVNFMSNPDEETAIAQFGSGDKYFGVCTLMATMPGLPMIGHGQIEGFSEKYGMEYKRSYKDEKPDPVLIGRHEREIFPLFRMRKLFAEVDNFYLFDFVKDHHKVDENVFTYTNGRGEERALVFYNNYWERTSGTISISCPYAEKDGSGKRKRIVALSEALALDPAPGNFVITREMRSNLYYIFKTADIHSHGWHVNLEGYQSLVFTDFTRVHDYNGSYQRLWENLHGQGVTDFEDALEEASHPELYHSLEKTIAAIIDFCLLTSEKISNAAQEKETGRIAEISEIYFARLAQIIVEEGGPAPLLDAVGSCVKTLKTGLKLIGSLVSDGNGALEIEQHNDLLEEFSRTVKTLKGRMALSYAVFILAISRLQREGNRTEELRFLLEKFLLNKKMLEAAENQAVSHIERPLGNEISALSEFDLGLLVQAFMTRPLPVLTAPQPNESGKSKPLFSTPLERAFELLQWAGNDPIARQALGVNEWQGIEYFSKEKMEALLFLGPSLTLLEEVLGTKAAEKTDLFEKLNALQPHVFSAIKTRDLILKAVVQSDYQLRSLVKLLTARGMDMNE